MMMMVGYDDNDNGNFDLTLTGMYTVYTVHCIRIYTVHCTLYRHVWEHCKCSRGEVGGLL